MIHFNKIFDHLFPPTYHCEVIRYWEYHSYNTKTNRMDYSHPMYIIWRIQKFHKPLKEYVFSGNDDEALTKALDMLKELNGSDYAGIVDGVNIY